MQLVCLMPTIHFRPTESRKKSAKGGTAPSDLPAPSLVWSLTHPLLHPSPTSAPALLSQRLQGSDSFSPFPQACTLVPAITIPTGQAAQTEPHLSLALT